MQRKKRLSAKKKQKRNLSVATLKDSEFRFSGKEKNFITMMKYVMSTETPYLDKVFIDYLMIRVKNTVKFWDGDFNKTLRCRRSDFKYKFNCFKVELMLINSINYHLSSITMILS